MNLNLSEVNSEGEPQLLFLFLFVICAGWQTSVTVGALDPGLSDGDAGPASVFVFRLSK